MPLLLISFGALFVSANAKDAYNKLPETYRKGVDLAVERLNSHSGIQHHFLFYRSIAQSDTEVLYMHVMLVRISAHHLFGCGLLLNGFL